MTTNQIKLESLGIDLRSIRKSGKTKCPKCGPTAKHRNKQDLSVNVEEGWYNCFNPGCDFKGNVTEKESKPEYQPKKDYKRPVFNNRTNFRENTVKWLFGERGISQQTIIDARMTEGPAWMPQVFGAKLKELLEGGMPEETAKVEANKLAVVNTLQFNYFRNGELINVKYRDGKKNFRLEKAAELIFYGYDDVKDVDWCVIVEGEFDKEAWREVGVKEVISVPNGAVIPKNQEDLKMEYLDNCIELFTNKTKIIIATDNDEPGRFLRDELARRLGKERCFKVDFGGCKDSNEYLKKYGDKLREVISDSNLIEYPLSGVITMDMVWDEMQDIMENGLPLGRKIDLREVDDVVTWIPGYFWMVTGAPNSGKSPLTLQVACMLAVQHGWKFGIFSPEHRKAGQYMIKIMEMIVGRRAPFRGLTDEEKRVAKIFINDHFFLIKPEDKDNSLDSIISHAKSLVRKKGIRGVIADPWNKFEHNRPTHLNETEYISRELDKITDFCEVNEVMWIQVAHPTKLKKTKEGAFEVPTLYDIASSANFYNKCDGGISIHRNHQTKCTEFHSQKVKDDHIGRLGMANLHWNPVNGRLGSPGKPDNSNWLAPKPEQAKMELVYFEPEPEVAFQTNVDIDDDAEELPF